MCDYCKARVTLRSYCTEKPWSLCFGIQFSYHFYDFDTKALSFDPSAVIDASNKYNQDLTAIKSWISASFPKIDAKN